jgi:uncharacterized membrane protein
MNRIAEFSKTTIIGGLLVLLPAYLSVLLLLHAIGGVFALIQPISSHLPGGPVVARVAAVVVVLVLSFVAGIVVRTSIGRRADALLERIPGYSLIRSLGRRFTGEEGDVSFAVALVEIEDALVPAFLIEEHPDGSFTVFVPSVPTPAAGAVYVLAKARVHRVDVPLTTAVRCITRWGAGTSELLQAMRKVESHERAGAAPMLDAPK